jgi:hypothetical protein
MSEEETATEETTEEAPKQEEQSNPLYKTLFDIAEEVTEEVEEEERGQVRNLSEAVDAEEPVQEAVQEEAEPEAVEPEKKEPKKKKLRKVVDPDIPEAVRKQPAHQEKVEDEGYIGKEDQEFMDGLMPEEQVVYEKILYADRKLGGDYKGKSEKFRTFLKKSKDYIDKKMSEDDFYDPSQDEQYSQFIQKNKPKFTRADEDKVYREMILEEAEKRTSKKTSDRIANLERQLQKYEVQPKVQQAKANFRKVAQDTIIPEEYKKMLGEGKQEDIQRFSQENPFEYKILENYTQQLLTYSDALTDIFLDPGTQLDIENNPIHKDLNQWIEKEQESFVQSGQTEQDGKIFMRRERYYAMPEDKRSEYYTWSDNDIMKILAIRYQNIVNNALDQQKKQMEAAGYTKAQVSQQPVQQQPKVVAQPKPKPPSVSATPRQGNTVDAKPSVNPKQNALLGALGL